MHASRTRTRTHTRARRYVVTIVTGDEFNAGTNASVSIVLYGASLPCGPHCTLHIACFTPLCAMPLPRDGAATNRDKARLRRDPAVACDVNRG